VSGGESIARPVFKHPWFDLECSFLSGLIQFFLLFSFNFGSNFSITKQSSIILLNMVDNELVGVFIDVESSWVASFSVSLSLVSLVPPFCLLGFVEGDEFRV
jgi:hypothetical protein